MQPRESWASVGPRELASRLREQTSAQTGCGHPAGTTTSGLVAYLDGEPVGWCGIDRRTAHPRLLRNNRVPWEGRNEDRTDNSVWVVTCFVTRVGFRRRGISRALAQASVDFARTQGARAVEGYPMLTEPGKEITWGEFHVGSRSIFADAGSSRSAADPTASRDAHRPLGLAVRRADAYLNVGVQIPLPAGAPQARWVVRAFELDGEDSSASDQSRRITAVDWAGEPLDVDRSRAIERSSRSDPTSLTTPAHP